MFGCAIHETIQAYLVAYYERDCCNEADALPLGDILHISVWKRITNEAQEKLMVNGCRCIQRRDGRVLSMTVFNIIDEFLKRKSQVTSKRKTTELVGIELDLDYELTERYEVRWVIWMWCYTTRRLVVVRIIDIKSSTMGWNKYMKADKNKTNQLLLYKHFYGKTSRDIPEDKIDVEYLILKRRLYENTMYPQKRIQAFSPASGKPSVE